MENENNTTNFFSVDIDELKYAIEREELYKKQMLFNLRLISVIIFVLIPTLVAKLMNMDLHILWDSFALITSTGLSLIYLWHTTKTLKTLKK